MNLTYFKTTTTGLAALTLCATVLAADKELTLDELFPTDRVLDVQITVAGKDWDKIRHQSRDFVSALHEKRKTEPIDGPYDYVNADMTIDGMKFEKIGLRKKGFIGSQSSSRPSLKIKLNYTDKEQSHRRTDEPDDEQQQAGWHHREPIHGLCAFQRRRVAGVALRLCKGDSQWRESRHLLARGVDAQAASSAGIRR